MTATYSRLLACLSFVYLFAVEAAAQFKRTTARAPTRNLEESSWDLMDYYYITYIPLVTIAGLVIAAVNYNNTRDRTQAMQTLGKTAFVIFLPQLFRGIGWASGAW